MTEIFLWALLALRTYGALARAVTRDANTEAFVALKTNAKVERVVLDLAYDGCFVGLALATGYWQLWAMVAIPWAVALVASLAGLGSRT